ncbi:transporter substrate-binding domain-containing protein [Agarivorans aestuarii]|uniref:Transporter substrate-binding domain-containing protein n=1 Tax=Agarivorans aestuarii TaxID=1563703 RepID=A0ABU7G650_9ALTE|nr:transporter substrate-binding domain-containing protein [Agarivorans aestuarii]MEE1674760.1 transporter substrate-binding domain-containing protein [Agarivorans aestuarii]
MLRTFLCLSLLIVSSQSIAESITIASGEHPPFTSQYREDGGLINAIVKASFTAGETEVSFRYLPWQRALVSSQVGSYAATSYWAFNAERQQFFLHSEPIWYGGSVLVSLNSTGELNSLASLKGKVVGAVRGYTYSDEFWLNGKKGLYQIEVVNSDLQNLKKLFAKRIDALLIDRVAATTLINRYLSPQQRAVLCISNKDVITSSVHLLISRKTEGATKLLESFNRGLAKIVNSGQYQLIADRYPMITHGFLK